MNDQELRNQLARMLTIRQAHMDFEDAVKDFPLDQINTQPPNTDYSFWHLIEHIRIAQRDILDYIVSEDYIEREFPAGYWPDKTIQADASMWQATIDGFTQDREQLVAIVLDAETDLFAPLPNSGKTGHNIVREINIIANHNAYHTGEMGILRQVLELWPE